MTKAVHLPAETSNNPRYQIQFLACGTACVCMVLVVGGILIGVINGTLSPALLGDYKTGAGLVGVLFVFYRVIVKALA
jgi:hypothetical protein